MTVTLLFHVDANEFVLGRILAGPPPMQYELERIIPIGHSPMPYLWVTGSDFEAFEQKVRSDAHIKGLRALDKVGDSVLYRLEYSDEFESLLEGILESEATVLDARGNDDWMLRVRFPDHEKLSQYYNYLNDLGITLRVDRIYTMDEDAEPGHQFGLTPDQREALVLALNGGYFATPSEITLDELANQLGITRQAVSNRVRLGNEKVLHSVLVSSASDF
ncbi:helix-turn-helix domain-containing protein [Haladaptatus sp. NG-WS-4]